MFIPGELMTGIMYLLINSPPRLAAIIRGHEASAASPCPSHAASGTEKLPWAILAFRDLVGATAADMLQRRPEWGSFSEGGNQTFFENLRNRVFVGVTHQAGVESAVGREIRIFDESTAILTDGIVGPPFQCGHGADLPVNFAEVNVTVKTLQQAQVLFSPGRCNQRCISGAAA